MTPAEAVPRLETILAHAWMVRTFLKHAEEIQLVVVGARNAESVGELIGPLGLGALHNTDCSILIADRQRLL